MIRANQTNPGVRVCAREESADDYLGLQLTTNMVQSLMVNTNDCITATAFAKKAGISRQAVNKMIRQGKIKAEMIARTYLIEKKDLVQYLAKKTK